MSRNTALKGLGQLTLAALGLVLAAAPPARADTEMAPHCFQLSPYPDTLTIMRVSSDYAPGIQALFVRWLGGTSYQLHGTGVRTPSLTSASEKVMTISLLWPDNGSQYKLVATFDPSTATGPWTLYRPDGSTAAGTLTKFSCSSPGMTYAAEADALGLLGPAPTSR